MRDDVTVSLRCVQLRRGLCLTLAFWCLWVVSCGADEGMKAPYRPVLWGEPAGAQMLVHDEALTLDQEQLLEGRFEDGVFQGYRVYGGVYTVLELTLRRQSGGSDPVLVVYGPRQDGGVWGRHVAFDDDGGDRRDARLAALKLPELGEYLVVVTTFDGQGQGGYELTARCASGCNVEPCQMLECHVDDRCGGSFLNDARGCRSCQCAADCQTSADCGASQVCVEGECRDDCTCSDDLVEVCGADGVTYANACEARCLGVEVIADQACAQQCPEISCDQSCPSGQALDASGCPTCECLSPCEACDERFDPVCTRNGETFLNACDAECRGELVAYAGRCQAECPVMEDCALDCEVFGRDEAGCPTCACLQGVCTNEREPVCGANGVTYNNPCEAERAGVEVVFEDVCPPLCRHPRDCPGGLLCRPLGGRDELCEQEARCAGVCVLPETPGELLCDSDQACWPGFGCEEGVCVLGCNCSPIYNPVCGANGETYLNSCVARCDGGQHVDKVGACCGEDVLDGCTLRCENGMALNGDGCEVCECRQAPPCECQPVENPVCGADQQTYSNPCEANCAGLDWTAGACR